MKDYNIYTVEDFIADASYVSYYLQHKEEDVIFWTDWISLHPEKLDVIMSANNYIEALTIRLSEAEFEQEQQRFAQALAGVNSDISYFSNFKGDNRMTDSHIYTVSGTSYPKSLKRTRFLGLILIVLIGLYILLAHLMNLQ